MQEKWIARIKRRPSDVNVKSMRVCSDHFEDDDFIYSDLLQVDILLKNGRLEELTGKKIKLKNDAVPNTDRGSKLIRVGLPKAYMAVEQVHSSPKSSRKRLRRDFDRVDELIDENQSLLGYQQLDSGPSCSAEQDLIRKDQAVQCKLSATVKSQYTQIGNPSVREFGSPYLESNREEQEDSSYHDDPEYIPSAGVNTGNKLDFTQRYTSDKHKSGKIDVSHPVSRVLGIKRML